MKNLLNISEAANIALHTCTYLAGQLGRKVSSKEIAQKYSISETHLAKVLQRLVRGGLLRSVRGPGGGFELVADPADLVLLQVLEAIEGPLPQGYCLFENRVCDRSQCIMGDELRTIHDNLRDYFTKTRLSSLVQKDKDSS